MNIYEKIQEVKKRLLEENIKKSGQNKYAGYNYYELADFTPSIIKHCHELKLFTSVSFDKELARLTIINSEDPVEQVYYTSPMEELELKGCNKIQALGGVETYSRRYLYMSAFDIIESDMFDGVNGKEEAKIGDSVIDETKAQALVSAINNAKIDEKRVLGILAKHGYNSIIEIKTKEYKEIVDELKALKEA